MGGLDKMTVPEAATYLLRVGAFLTAGVLVLAGILVFIWNSFIVVGLGAHQIDYWGGLSFEAAILLAFAFVWATQQTRE